MSMKLLGIVDTAESNFLSIGLFGDFSIARRTFLGSVLTDPQVTRLGLAVVGFGNSSFLLW
jgi:hypothetical protein